MTVRHIYLLIAALPIFVCGMATVSQAQRDGAQWGEIVYPLPGNIRTTEGTFLVHFRIEEDLTADAGAWHFPRESPFRFILARVRVNEEHSITIYFRRQTGAMWTSLRLPGAPPNLIDRNGIVSGSWRQGGSHWVAYTWDRDGTHSFWLDGRQVRRQSHTEAAQGIGPIGRDAQLTLGGGRSSPSALTLFGVHVLGEALPDEVLRENAPEELLARRDGTLLLDVFDHNALEAGDARETRARSISTFSGERGGKLAPAVHLVDTPDGRGLRIYRAPAGVSIP